MDEVQMNVKMSEKRIAGRGPLWTRNVSYVTIQTVYKLCVTQENYNTTSSPEVHIRAY